MGLTCIFTLLFSAIVATHAFKVPEGATDGFHMAYYDEDGQEVHLRNPDQTTVDAHPLAARTPPVVPKPERNLLLAARDDEWRYHCGCGIEMNHGDCDAAVADLTHQLDTSSISICPGLTFYSIRGSVVAFACNFGDSIQCESATGQQYGDMLKAITSRCGWYVPGTYRNGQYYWDDTNLISWNIDYGYMRSSENGGNFYGAAEASGAEHC
ncbi:hypothetical protein GQ53DRAFT_430442 [Thozetella sp. PMI_491]|nr:hypothetical protein GQ53DRAFT_430442 [Thozetella sp. PMI_491]